LAVCTWRLERRKRRPKSELVVDPCQQCLEEEKRVIDKARKELYAAAHYTKKLIVEAEDIYNSLDMDHRDKSQAALVDKRCLQWMSASGNVSALPNGGASARAAKEIGPKFGGESAERSRVMNTQHLSDFSRDMEARLHNTVAKNQQLIQQLDRDCDVATKTSESQLKKKINETEQLAQGLHDQINLIDDKIENSVRTLQQTRDQLRAYDAPMAVAKTQLNWRRSMMPGPEVIDDPVHKGLQNQLRSHAGDTQALHDKIRSLEHTIRQLETTKARLLKNMEDKTKARDLDRTLNMYPHARGAWLD